jgi:hypothetical protein
MKSFKKETKHFLGIVLCKALELSCSPSNNLFDIPWSYIFLIAHVHISEKLSIFICQATACTKFIASVYMILINIKKEELDKWLSIREALEDTVHKTSVTQVL